MNNNQTESSEYTRVGDYQIQCLDIGFDVTVESGKIIDVQIRNVKQGLDKKYVEDILKRFL